MFNYGKTVGVVIPLVASSRGPKAIALVKAAPALPAVCI